MAFSNGSLPDGWIHRLQKKQPLAAPSDVKRYFVSPEESGQICMLACILGNGGEVFFPKLGEDQMLTFSSICDEFVRSEGFTKKECGSDAEAKQYAAKMGYDSDIYPVVYFRSDTTGEKAYEEFYIPGERINMNRFMALGVVEETTRRPMPEVNAFFEKLETLFAKEDLVRQAHHKSAKAAYVYPEPVEGKPSRSLSRTLSTKRRGRTWIRRCKVGSSETCLCVRVHFICPNWSMAQLENPQERHGIAGGERREVGGAKGGGYLGYVRTIVCCCTLSVLCLEFVYDAEKNL